MLIYMLKNARMYSILLVVICLFAADGMAAMISGANPELDALGGAIYIPLKPETSGVLGDTLASGNEIGEFSDSVEIHSSSGESSGFVTFDLTFDLTHGTGVSQQISPAFATLFISFHDMDFKPDVYSNYTLRESMVLQFKADANDAGRTQLLIDENNYGYYSGGFFGETDNSTVNYEIDLRGDLGVTQPDLADIVEDGEFVLSITMHATVGHTSSGSDTIYNTPESIANSFRVVAMPVVPEPATIGLLASGAGLLIRRRKRNQPSLKR